MSVSARVYNIYIMVGQKSYLRKYCLVVFSETLILKAVSCVFGAGSVTSTCRQW